MSSNNARESSLPTQRATNIRSSPPIVTIEPTSPQMAEASDFKTEPFTPQSSRTRQPVQSRVSAAEVEQPPSAQQPQPDAEEEAEPEEEVEEDESGPAEKIASFDWEDLLQRYHDQVGSCQGQERALMEEWESLMKYFCIWADAGHEHETDRTYKRLRTRMEHVQNSERNLETTRQHYVNVVRAFESALNLLKTSAFGG